MGIAQYKNVLALVPLGIIILSSLNYGMYESEEAMPKLRFFWDNCSNPKETIPLLTQYYSKIDFYSPVWYVLLENGSIGYSRYYSPHELLDICNKHHIDVHPLVSNYHNGKMDEQIVSSLLNNKTKIDNFIASLNELIGKYNFSGVNIDFEDIPKADKNALLTFLEKVKFGIDPKIILSIDVPFKSIRHRSDWNSAFNYRKIAKIVDFVMVMTYNAHGSWSKPGEIAPISWAKSILSYAQRKIPSEKLFVGIPRYGYDWIFNESWGGKSYSSYSHFVQRLPLTCSIERTENMEIVFSYRDGKYLHTCYFCDSTTTIAKEKALEDRLFRGFCYWHLTSGDNNFFEKI
ncbi:MAG: hypothetical protein GF308_18355 [Candidatus Heimdallarchaeota archaeon]|nr:hypothetical protein [Candidatus Heimdallarchaeota archaeon]